LFFRKQKAAQNDNRVEPVPVAPSPEAPGHSSVIAAGTLITGNLDCEKDILIDGRVHGSVRAMRLTVGLDGAIEGDVSADEVTVRGSVKGPIHARHIHLESGAEVEGDLTTTTIAIDTGARLSGAVWQQQEHEGAAPERYTPIAAGNWEKPEEGSRSLLGSRPRIITSGR
jgi:cytoskeletal protein CcmA (bactofilin family)